MRSSDSNHAATTGALRAVCLASFSRAVDAAEITDENAREALLAKPLLELAHTL